MSTNTIRLNAEIRADTARPRAGGWPAGLKNGLEWLRRVHQRRRAIAELSRMADWRLADLGIPRDRIAEVVDGLIEREGPTAGR
jgi:uncharacterized protein YjiS (DUF1127 family)